MNEEIKQLKQEAEVARAEYRTGCITRDEAKDRIMPYINAVNERSKKLAKKYNQKYKAVSLSVFLR